MSFAHLAAFAATALVLALPVQARPDPLNPRAEVPPPRTPAALRGYRPATTPEPGQWREANDNVARIGGWKTYLREAQQADAAPAAAPAAPAASAPRPAGHHHGHR
jgi:hypothetical protein